MHPLRDFAFRSRPRGNIYAGVRPCLKLLLEVVRMPLIVSLPAERLLILAPGPNNLSLAAHVAIERMIMLAVDCFITISWFSFDVRVVGLSLSPANGAAVASRDGTLARAIAL